MHIEFNFACIQKIQNQCETFALFQVLPQSQKPEMNGLWPHGNWLVWSKVELHTVLLSGKCKSI